MSYQNNFLVGGSPLSIKIGANVSNFHGVITKYYNPKGIMSSFWVGEKLGTIWGYRVDGQFQSDAAAKKYENSFKDPSKNLRDVYNYVINVVQNSKWQGLKAGDPKYIDVNGDGKIGEGNYTLKNHGDLRPIGDAQPKFPFGFNFSARWKGIDLSVIGSGIGHQDWYPRGFIFGHFMTGLILVHIEKIS